MSRVSGLETRRLHALAREKAVDGFTVDTQHAADADSIEPPVVDYLPKPFALSALLEKVRSAVAENRPREPSNRHRDCPELFIG